MLEKVAVVWYILYMGKRFFLTRLFLGFILFAFFALPLSAQNFLNKISWLIDGTVLFFPEDNGVDSDPMPVLPSFGFGASYTVIKDSIVDLSLELTFDFYMTHYGYSDKLERAVPTAIENRTARVLGFIFGFNVSGSYQFNSFIRTRLYAGPAADLRAVFRAAGLNAGLDNLTEIDKEVDSTRNYFWSSGRWFLPVAGTGVDFKINDTFKLGIDFRVWMPMYKLWSGEDLPAIEGWRFGAGVRLTIR